MAHGLRQCRLASMLAAVAAIPANGFGQSVALPDAQIEANVLRQLASAPELSTQNIQSTTVYGTVTLTGNVRGEEMRNRAENLAARAQGVKKVIDELTLSDASAEAAQVGAAAGQAPAPTPSPTNGEVLQSDGTYAPAQATDGVQSQGYSSPPSPGQDAQPAAPAQPGYGNVPNASPATQPPYNGGAGFGRPPYSGDQQAYGNAPPPGYGQQASGRQPLYGNKYAPGYSGGPQGGQVGGQQVNVPAGAPLQVRLDRGFDANHVIAGTPFSGTIMADVVAGGSVAIPRGATVQGTVVDAKKAGVLKGEAELGLQINGLSLGGQTYPLISDVWQREGRDKTVGTVNSALGLGALGAVIGGVTGGGAGAAIGAGVGGAAGVAGSAASPNGRVIVPAEAVLSFQLAQPVTVTTVGQAELSRLAYAAGPNPGPRPVPRRRYYSPYYGYYYGPPY